jgi:methylthioribose-1-phosphate isomerase
VTTNDYCEVIELIKTMAIRGAPAIGVAGAYALVMASLKSEKENFLDFKHYVYKCAEKIKFSRPTAVNLSWAVDRLLLKLETSLRFSIPEATHILLTEAKAIFDEDIEINKKIGNNALPLIKNDSKIIHHCNTGSLATVEYGTALGIIRISHEHGKNVFVFVDETRPRLQGSKLTAWELKLLNIPHKVIVDSASGLVMKRYGVNMCIVGCDRVARNGDTANKIGTYNLAIVARAHNVPFYVAAPTSTIDLSIQSGDFIEIEERNSNEITRMGDYEITPSGTEVFNPAFDITPAKLITAFITEKGIIYPPFEQNFSKIM